MTTIHSFEDMHVWRESRMFLQSVRLICKTTAKNDWSFIDQITRSTRSISANIAEGFESSTNAEFMQFLGYAKRSAGESRSHLFDALDEGYISLEEFRELRTKAQKISRMLSSLIGYLEKSKTVKRSYNQNNLER